MWSSSVPDPSVRRRDDRLEPAVAGTPEKKSRHDTGIDRSVKPGVRQPSRAELVRVVVQIGLLGPVGALK